MESVTGGLLGNVRILASVVLGIAALLAAIYLAGYLSLQFLGLDGGQVGWSTYFDYLRHLDHPRVQPYAWRIKTAGAIGGGAAEPGKAIGLLGAGTGLLDFAKAWAQTAPWKPEAQFQQELKAQGYSINNFKVTKGQCYEIYGTDKTGKKVEIYFDPATGRAIESK